MKVINLPVIILLCKSLGDAKPIIETGKILNFKVSG